MSVIVAVRLRPPIARDYLRTTDDFQPNIVAQDFRETLSTVEKRRLARQYGYSVVRMASSTEICIDRGEAMFATGTSAAAHLPPGERNCVSRGCSPARGSIPNVHRFGRTSSAMTAPVGARSRSTSSRAQPFHATSITATEEKFEFHFAFGSSVDEPGYSTQSDVFKHLGVPAVSSAMEGFNGCIMAYGQTGSGKTYSMIGPGWDSAFRSDFSETHRDAGLMLRVCREIFRQIDIKSKGCDPDELLENIRSHRASSAERESGTEGQKAASPTSSRASVQYTVEATYFEIYGETVYDLLQSKNSGPLRVREDRVVGPFVEKLRHVAVADYNVILPLLERGSRSRKVATTVHNRHSSRSHAIFTLHIKQSTRAPDGTLHTRTNLLHLVDLAGSERLGGTKTLSHERLREATKINGSLAVLGHVIQILSDRKCHNRPLSAEHLPFRESTLTWLLKECFGGNSKTTMLSTISPELCDLEETRSTLAYACLAKKIVNKPTITRDSDQKKIVGLKLEIAELKAKLTAASLKEKVALQDELLSTQQLLQQMTCSWEIKIQESHEIVRNWEKEREELLAECRNKAETIRNLRSQVEVQEHTIAQLQATNSRNDTLPAVQRGARSFSRRKPSMSPTAKTPHRYSVMGTASRQPSMASEVQQPSHAALGELIGFTPPPSARNAGAPKYVPAPLTSDAMTMTSAARGPYSPGAPCGATPCSTGQDESLLRGPLATPFVRFDKALYDSAAYPTPLPPRELSGPATPTPAGSTDEGIEVDEGFLRKIAAMLQSGKLSKEQLAERLPPRMVEVLLQRFPPEPAAPGAQPHRNGRPQLSTTAAPNSRPITTEELLKREAALRARQREIERLRRALFVREGVEGTADVQQEPPQTDGSRKPEGNQRRVTVVPPPNLRRSASTERKSASPPTTTPTVLAATTTNLPRMLKRSFGANAVTAPSGGALALLRFH